MPDHLRRKPVALSEVFLKGTLVQNPVLVGLIGICPVVAAAVSVRAAALLAGVSSLILIISQVVASVFLKKIIRWVRVAVYLLIGLAVVAPVMWLLEKYDAGVRITVGIYLPLLAANSLIALRCEKIAVRSSATHSFWDALAASIGYSAVLLIAGFIRELFGSGKILEKPVSFLPAASGLLMPFGGFIVLGFMAAALKAFVMRRYPKYAKSMNIEISSTAVTLKLKSGSDTGNAEEIAAAPAEVPEPVSPADAGTGQLLPDDAKDAGDDTGEDSSGSDKEALPAAECEKAESAPENVTRPEISVSDGIDGDSEAEALPEKESGGVETAVEAADEALTDEPKEYTIPMETVEQSAPLAEEAPNPANDKEDISVDSESSEPDIFEEKLKELFKYLEELEKSPGN